MYPFVDGAAPRLMAINGILFLDLSRHTSPLASISYQRDRMALALLSVSSLLHMIL
jgi:hypothetical protein